MSFHFGLVDVTAPDEGYIRMLKHLIDYIRGSHVGSGAINAGGAAYTLGDILTITGGTEFGDSALGAEFEVTAEAAGVITTLRLNNSGSYGIEPATLTGNALIGGTGAGATVDLIMSSWATAVPNAGGAGYVVGEILTLVGGTVETTAATFEVLTVSMGAVVTVKPVNIGDYSQLPVNPVVTTASAAGTGATLDVTRAGWLIRNTNYVDDQTDHEMWAEGVNDAGSNPFMGAFTETEGLNPQWMLAGASSFDGGQLWENQPNISPVSAMGNSIPTSRVPLTAGDMRFFFFVSPRRFIMVGNQVNTYEMIYCGLINPFIDSPATNYPLPALVSGTTQRSSEDISDVRSSLHTPIARPGSNQHFLRDQLGSWNLQAASGNSPWKLWPDKHDADITNKVENQAPNIATGSGTEVASGGLWQDAFWDQSPDAHGYAPVGVGAQTYLVVPFTLFNDQPGTIAVIGELDGVFKLGARDLTSENLILDQLGFEHIVFPIINLTSLNDFYTIRME